MLQVTAGAYESIGVLIKVRCRACACREELESHSDSHRLDISLEYDHKEIGIGPIALAALCSFYEVGDIVLHHIFADIYDACDLSIMAILRKVIVR
jgi:hypothetical protein